MEIKVKKIHPDAIVPSFANQTDAGMDLFSIEDVILKPGELQKIKTGLAIELPEGYVSLVWDKSGIASKYIKTVAGVIDAGYRGEYLIALINLGKDDYLIRKGDKIAQVLIQEVNHPKVIETDNLSETSRGEGGFGSTGLKKDAEKTTNRGKAEFIRKNRTGWDDLFMQIALTIADRTACIFHKVGSVFVDDHHRIVSLGYNGSSSGDYHCNEDGCAKVHGDPETGEIRRCRGVHSEINGIMNSGNPERLRGSTLYVSLFPCYDCMKALNNVGVKRIVYYDEYLRVIQGSDGTKKESEPEARFLANRRGIVLDRYRRKEDETADIEKIELEKNEKPVELKDKLNTTAERW